MPIGYVVTRYRAGISTLLDVVATLPFAVAGTVLAIGFVVSFNSGPVILTGGPLILVLAYTIGRQAPQIDEGLYQEIVDGIRSLSQEKML